MSKTTLQRKQLEQVYVYTYCTYTIYIQYRVKIERRVFVWKIFSHIPMYCIVVLIMFKVTNLYVTS